MTAASQSILPQQSLVIEGHKMTTTEYLDALKTVYMPPYSRTTARELGVKIKEAESYANGAPIPEAVAVRVGMKLAIYYRWKALCDARKAVKEELRDKGIKLSRFAAAEITEMARERVERQKARAEQFTKACGARTSVERNSCSKWSYAMIVGYARVSTDGQSLEAQDEALRAAGAQRVFSEKQSGAKTDRAALGRCLMALEAGDTLLVTKLDRLARSTRDLLNTLAAINEKGASFKSLGDGWADTTTPHGRLMLTVLGGLAEFERHLILSRTNEGRVRAKARGVRFGRKPKLTAYQRQEALARLAQGETLTEIARSMAVSHMTISRLA
jgi:DNA invertase Pin-like site-specific DNA recombinase